MGDQREWTIYVCSCGLLDPADCGKDFDCEFSRGEEVQVVPARVRERAEQAEALAARYREALESYTSQRWSVPDTKAAQ